MALPQRTTADEPDEQDATSVDERVSRWGAFDYPNYRRYWVSSLALVFGMQFRFIAGGWLVHQLTDAPFWLGVPGIISAIATISLVVPAGALADRFDNQRLLVLGRGLTTLSYAAIATLTVTDVVEIWMVLVWAGVTGALGALTNPAQNAMLPRTLSRPGQDFDRSAMPSAVAYSGSIWNGMRVIGPAIAGVVIAVIGIGQAFFVTTAGFALSTLLVASMRLEPVRSRDGQDDEHAGMLAGVRYIFANRLFLATVGLSFFSSIAGSSYVVLLPVFADDILDVGVQGFGFMEAAAGVGALLGTLAIVRIGAGRHTGAVMIGSAALFGLWIAAFAASRTLPLSMALLFAGGFFSSVYLNLGMTTLQLMVPNALRGRVMGVWGLTWLLGPAGGFVAASLAELVGASVAVALGALSVAAFALLMYVAFAELRAIPSRQESIGAAAT